MLTGVGIVLFRLYRALVRSKLDYGCLIYGAACKSYISLLDPIQNQDFRLFLGAFRTTVFVLRQMSFLVTLEEKGLPSMIQFVIKIVANPNNPVYKTIFNQL